MLNRRTIWLLAAVMAVGCAYVAPGTRAERSAEVRAIASCTEQHCEQQLMLRQPKMRAEARAASFLFHSQTSQAQRLEWPASYQRPPTRNL
jgi:hypothetical protein